ncbi:hypothetical protein [Chitinophaga caseinilytica]|uniref:MAPEG family protein n=1 Tax=Chitinophaga caseinilytica TaxID=2267521 RepID=A0ABZ2Z1G2_9BACT
MQTLVIICGVYSLGFAGFHIAFWKLFGWKKDLGNLRFYNKAIMQILNLRLIYVFAFTAAVCFIFPRELATTALGKTFLAGNALFWLGRTIEQFIFLQHNSRMVRILTGIFILGFILFLLPVIF